MDTIYEQLKNYCDCLKTSDVNADNFNQNINQLIDLISTLTCWKSKPCETLLSSDRQEVFDINAVKSCWCDNGLMIVDLYYKEVKEETIKVTVQIRNGVQFEDLEIDTSDYSFNVYENKLYIDLSKYNINDFCSCEKVHKVIVEYTAGFELLPECLLPIFCDYLQYVIEYNRCDCNCDTCEDDTTNEEPQEPDTIEEYIQNSIFIAYKRQLETISLCGRNNWFVGMVV